MKPPFLLSSFVVALLCSSCGNSSKLPSLAKLKNLKLPSSEGFSDSEFNPLAFGGSKSRNSKGVGGASGLGSSFAASSNGGGIVSSKGIQIGSYVETSKSSSKIYAKLKKGEGVSPMRIKKGTPLQIIGKKGGYFVVRVLSTNKEGYIKSASISDRPVIPDIEPSSRSALAAAGNQSGVVDPDLDDLPGLDDAISPVALDVPIPEIEDPDGDGIVRDDLEDVGGIEKDE